MHCNALYRWCCGYFVYIISMKGDFLCEILSFKGEGETYIHIKFCLISLQFTRTMNIITHYGSSTSWNSNEHAINCSISFIWCKNDVFWVMQKSSQKRNFNRTHFTNNTTQYIYKDIINNTWMISCVCCVIVDFCTCLIVCFLISFLFRKGRSYINSRLLRNKNLFFTYVTIFFIS